MHEPYACAWAKFSYNQILGPCGEKPSILCCVGGPAATSQRTIRFMNLCICTCGLLCNLASALGNGIRRQARLSTHKLTLCKCMSLML